MENLGPLQMSRGLLSRDPFAPRGRFLRPSTRRQESPFNFPFKQPPKKVCPPQKKRGTLMAPGFSFGIPFQPSARQGPPPNHPSVRTAACGVLARGMSMLGRRWAQLFELWTLVPEGKLFFSFLFSGLSGSERHANDFVWSNRFFFLDE